MCGIGGYLGSQPPSREAVQAALSKMEHRGPDHAAARRWDLSTGRTTDLLYTRLSIIDPEPRSNQPFRRGSKSIVYNGELYNYKEMRSELQDHGYEFETESDTEVLLSAIDAWGWEALDRAEGMWAFAVHDEETETLTLSRDRFGEKPLYITEDSGGVAFASEIKVLRSLVEDEFPVDEDQIRRYLANGYRCLFKTPGTFFEGVHRVPPATCIQWDADGTSSRWRYWEPGYRADEEMTYDEAVAGVRKRLIRAMRLRLRADVPLAFCLSGGVDSNALISIADREVDQPVHGFTVVSEDERYAEADLVERSVRELGVKHTKVPADTDHFLDDLRQLVRQHDAPVFTITYFVHWLLMEQVTRHGYRVAISGTGADELFSGYYDHHLAYLAAISDDPDREREARQEWREHVEPLVRNPTLRDPDLLVENPEFRNHLYEDRPRWNRLLHEPCEEPFEEEDYTDDLLRNRMLNELFHEIIPVILHEEDHNAMACSIENRSPFLDRHLFEFCYSIPTRHLVRDGRAKAVLRDAMEGIMPEPIRTNRRKVGFNASVLEFLDTDDPDVRAEILDPSPIYNIVRRSHIEELLDQDKLTDSENKFVFRFLTSKMFLEEFGKDDENFGGNT